MKAAEETKLGTPGKEKVPLKAVTRQRLMVTVID
jgi:hypothetical protein